jgi:phospholipid-translocating ATPase
VRSCADDVEQVLTLRGTFHNPNLSHSKSRSFGLPSFLSTYFLNRKFKQEAVEAEEDRSTERKKGFWGGRKVRRPTLTGRAKDAAQDGEAGPSDGGDGAKTPDKDGAKGPLSEPKVPDVKDREEGDHYEDDADIAPPTEPSAPGHLLHMPHMPTLKHADKPLWVKESWEDLKVGDFVRLRGDESVPAGEFSLSPSSAAY